MILAESAGMLEEALLATVFEKSTECSGVHASGAKHHACDDVTIVARQIHVPFRTVGWQSCYAVESKLIQGPRNGKELCYLFTKW